MWRKLGVVNQPIVLVNFGGSYGDFLAWVATSKSNGFISESSASTMTVVERIGKLPQALEAPPSPGTETQIDDDFDWTTVTPVLGAGAVMPFVETLATLEPDPSGDIRPFHCLVALRFQEMCIVVDLVFSAVAFAIALGHTYEAGPLLHDIGKATSPGIRVP
ncbi:hypothetical protein Trco_004992 [Trichoderma cornu-damae]|uniref:Uncharacterized protein n=1 Tax=Trichoderma cornu-damae TaxID=654480 RepID=A0A9P8TUT1_9HYPO|nr:hypothetical protein Trco_004992 [Trichoderma cornu-damae]